MNSKLIKAVFFVCLAFIYPVQAEFTLESLKANLEQNTKTLDKPVVDFQKNYTGKLDGLKAKAQAAGDLDQMLAIDNEIKMVGKGGTEVPAKYPALSRLRKIYDEHVAKLNKDKNGHYQKLLVGHRARLGQLQKQLTIAGNIDQAMVVKREIETISAQIESGSGPSSPHPGIQGNRSPGKLVVFGTYSDGNPLTLSSEQQKQEYIRVSAGYNHWAALRADGKTTEKAGTREEFQFPRGTRNIVDIQCGRHMHMALKEDGSLISLGGADHTNLIPEEIEKGSIAKISCGHSKNAMLLNDGTLIPFGYSFQYENIDFPRKDLLVDVADVSVGAHGMAIKKKDGSLYLVSIKGEDVGTRPEGLKGKDVIQMEGGLNNGTIFLTKKGKVYSWNTMQPPSDLKKAVQIRAGAGLGAAQKEDGTWVIWGENQGIAAGLNEHVATLGPLKDLAVGNRYFVAIK